MHSEQKIVQYAFLSSASLPNTADNDELSMVFGFAVALAGFVSPEQTVLKVGFKTVFGNKKPDEDLESVVSALHKKHPHARVPVLTTVYYQAKTPAEFAKIRRFFESLPEEGVMPKKGQTSFQYD